MVYIGNPCSQGGALHHVRILTCGVLLALLITGCGDATDPDGPVANSSSNEGEKSAIEELLNSLDRTLVKVQGRQESFAAAGNTEGAQLMGEAADNVRAMKAAARASRDTASASATATTMETTVTAEQREALDQLLENRRQLEANIEEAQRCCGLPPDFLDEELSEVDSNIKSLRTQLGLEHEE